jgi:pimeloyl-ACP methyl ester carboxylesterase
MKKPRILAGIAMSLCLGLTLQNGAFAQAPDPSLSEQMDYLVAPLDFTEVTSGMLLDRGFQMMEIAAFDGSTAADTLFDYGDWFRQFGTLVTSSTNGVSPIGLTADYKPVADAMIKSGVIPIMILHAEYHKFIADSTLLSTLITYQNGQVHDVPGRTESPYAQHEIFSFSPKKSKMEDALSHDFRINSGFIRSNTSKTISTVEIDFDNGAGYQTLSLNTDHKISWPTYGKKYMKLRITYTDSSVYRATALFEIVDKSGSQTSGGGSQAKYSAVPDKVEYIPHPTLANHGATLSIAYGCGNTELRKPFIYVEGFNPEQWGNHTYFNSFYSDFIFYENQQWTTAFPLLSELEENGYDVVYVDFDQGAGSLIENAKTVQEVIKWVNEEKAANSSSAPNLVVGYSMGGVVARLALTYMEDDFAVSNNPDDLHDVSYYVSVDSPHLGANVPRGVIAALIDIRNYTFGDLVGGLFNVSEDVPQVEEAYQVLNSPAAKQMLLYSGEGSNTLITGHGPSYNSFQNHLQSQGMPSQTIENIAIAKGGGAGVGLFPSMSAIFDINTNTFNVLGCFTDVPGLVGWYAGYVALMNLGMFAKIVVDINAMPGYANNSLQIYERKTRIFLLFIPLQWETHNTYAETVNFYDGVQGGTYETSSFSGLDSEEAEEFLNDLLDGEFEPCAEMHRSNFTFIPTVSALDMGGFMGGPSGGSPNIQIDPLAIVNNGQTSFSKVFVLDSTKYPSGFIAPTNESHTDLTPSNVYPFVTFIPPAFTTNTIGTIDGFTYNHGRAGASDEYVQTSDRITRFINVGVNQTGVLCVNCTGVLDINTISTNPQNEADHFAVELTQNCVFGIGRLNIGANGTLKIGENSSKTGMMTVRDNSWIELNDGIIEIREGSKLIIDAGAELRLNGGQVKVYDGGEIIIKDGGVLIYEDGVSVELNGNDAQLALGGRTHVGNNATFTFTYQGNESGYIRLLEEGHWGERFSTGQNAKVHLVGEDINDKILHLEYSADFLEYIGNVPGTGTTSIGFQDILVKDGTIEFANNARFVAIAPAFFDRVRLTGSVFSRGVVAFQDIKLRQCDVQSTKIDAQLQFYGNGILDVEGSDFNGVQIEVKGRGYNIRYSDFQSSIISSSEGSVASRFTGSTHLSPLDAAIVDVSPTDLIITRSQFNDAYTGILKEKGNLRIKCSDFTNFDRAIELYTGSSLNMSTRLQGGYNFFDDNGYNVYMQDAVNLMLADGYNELYDGTEKNIFGTLDMPHTPCPPAFDLNNNTWTPASSSSPPNPLHPDLNEFYGVILSSSGIPTPLCVLGWDFGTVAPVVRCGEFDEPPVAEPIGKSGETEVSLLPYISTPLHFDSVRFDLALAQATALIAADDSAGTNPTAAEM